MTPNGALSQAPTPHQAPEPVQPPVVGFPTGPPGAPGPPRGPGVAPPFVAPPSDRDSKTIWVRVGVSALLVVLSCLAGSAGLGVVVAASRQIEVQARDLVDQYLGALRSQEYRTAYGLLCETELNRISVEDFTAKEQERPIVEYDVREVRGASELVVGASVTYRGSPATAREYVINMEGQLRVCGER